MDLDKLVLATHLMMSWPFLPGTLFSVAFAGAILYEMKVRPIGVLTGMVLTAVGGSMLIATMLS